jgi:hypothetical protein
MIDYAAFTQSNCMPLEPKLHVDIHPLTSYPYMFLVCSYQLCILQVHLTIRSICQYIIIIIIIIIIINFLFFIFFQITSCGCHKL